MTEQKNSVNWAFYNQRARTFVDLMSAGKYESAAEMLDSTMAGLMPPEALKKLWVTDIGGIAGKYQSIYAIHNSIVDGYYISQVIMRHEKIGFGWNLVFDAAGEISGIWTTGTVFLPA